MPGTKDWLRKANSDVKLAIKAIGDEETLDSAIYLTHQCAEKSLKTFYVKLGKEVPRTHDLPILLDGCTKVNRNFLLLQTECGILDPYGRNARYPSDRFRVNQEDLVQAIEMATKILEFVRTKVL